MKEILLRRYEKNYRRLHRSNGHKHFLTECSKNTKFPKFTWIQPQIAEQLNLNSTQINLNHLISVLSTLIHHDDLKISIENIKQKIYNSEKTNDARRKQKLDLLINDSNRENNVQKAEINVFNFTKNNKNIPLKIKKLVSLGIKNPIGGRAIKNNILNKIEAFYTDWLKHAHEVKVDCFKIAEICSLIYLQMQKLNKCTTPTNAAKELTTYLDNNKDIIIIQIDKSKDLAILSIEDYSFKLNSIFSPDKFSKTFS